MNFQEKLDAIVKKNTSLVCVGLDPDLDKLPDHIKEKDNPLFSFNKEIIDATADLVCAFKPNSAFYEAIGEEGIRELRMTCDYLKMTHPDVPIILDAKRADIGHTNDGYVQYAFDYLQVDAITVQPYLGSEAIAPFLKRTDKGIIVLCRTSNPGAGELQDLEIKGKKLYEIIAEKVVNDWNKNNNCLLVIGATYPKELKEIRNIVGDMTFLVPGVGAQGGEVADIVTHGLNSKKAGMIISSSRGVIYAGNGVDFAQKSREACEKLKVEINTYR